MCVCVYNYYFFFFFLGLYLQHRELPRLGVELEWQLPAYVKRCQIRAASATYTAAQGNARSLTH